MEGGGRVERAERPGKRWGRLKLIGSRGIGSMGHGARSHKLGVGGRAWSHCRAWSQEPWGGPWRAGGLWSHLIGSRV